MSGWTDRLDPTKASTYKEASPPCSVVKRAIEGTCPSGGGDTIFIQHQRPYSGPACTRDDTAKSGKFLTLITSQNI